MLSRIILFSNILDNFLFPFTPVKQFLVWHMSIKVTNEYPISVRTLGNTILISTLTQNTKI